MNQQATRLVVGVAGRCWRSEALAAAFNTNRHGMYHRGEIDHWTDAELVELWRERSAMRCCNPDPKYHAQADYSAGQEIRKWITKPLPAEIKDGMRAKFSKRQ